MRALADAARWATSASLPQGDIFARLQAMPSQEIMAADSGGDDAPAAVRTIEAAYTRAYHMHGSIGPSCAVALRENDALTVWTHSQGVYPLRAAIAEMLKMPPARVQCVHVEGSGCYGHNAADDVAAYAALLARAVPGRPIRLQWMREQEHMFEPYGSAMVAKHRAGIDASGNVVAWTAEGWSGTHSTRPGDAGNLMPAWYVEEPFTQPVPEPIPLPEAAATATRFRSTRCPRCASSIASSPKCRCASRRCARSALTSTCSRSKASWTSSRVRQVPTRSRSGCATLPIGARAMS
jgi:CO/xanthine dehydrogenase Mo-binding subunit